MHLESDIIGRVVRVWVGNYQLDLDAVLCGYKIGKIFGKRELFICIE